MRKWLYGCWSRRLLREVRWRMDVRLSYIPAGIGLPWDDWEFRRLAALEKRLAARCARQGH